MKSTADTFTAAYNAAGAQSSIVSLPNEGIYGNDHMIFRIRTTQKLPSTLKTGLRKMYLMKGSN